MTALDEIEIELTIRIGEAEMALGKFLRLSRGSVIPLGRDECKPLDILANGRKIATGRVHLQGENVGVSVDDSQIAPG